LLEALGQGREELLHVPVQAPALGAQRFERLMLDRAEAGRDVRATFEAGHPDPIAQQQVIERAVHAAEEGAEIAAILRAGKPGADRIQRFVGQPVIAGVLPPHAHVASAGSGGDPARDVTKETGEGGAAQAQGAGFERLAFGDGGIGNGEHGKDLQGLKGT